MWTGQWFEANFFSVEKKNPKSRVLFRLEKKILEGNLQKRIRIGKDQQEKLIRGRKKKEKRMKDEEGSFLSFSFSFLPLLV
jgi:hypothetical protein